MDKTSNINKETVTEEVLSFIDILKTRPRMLITEEVTYARLRLFIEGYINGLMQILHNNLMLHITHWFQKKVNQKGSVFFTNHIPHFYSDKNDEELKTILLQTLEEFFKENPDWQKKYIP